ncbi:unnamed protein product [Prunus armeniaca]
MVIRSLDTKKDPYRPKGDDEMVLGPDVPYLSAIGALLYLAQCIILDIAFSVNLLARYSSAPTSRHWTRIKHILRYLRGTADMGLFYSNESTNAPSIVGYADARYLSDPYVGCSQTGSVIHHIRSTCALPVATNTPTILNEDNATCIAQITGGYIKGDKTKHIKSQEIKVRQIRSSDNLENLFTKSFPKCTFQKLMHGIGLRQLCKQLNWSMQNQGEHSRVL